MKKYIIISALCFVVALAWFGRDFLSPQVENMQLIDIHQQPHDLLKGSVTLVNMWASDCVACDKEMPKLKALHQKYSDQGFRVLAVALSYDKLRAIHAYTSHRQLNFPVIYDQDESIVANFGGVKVTPTSFLIDKKGHILFKAIGEPNWQQWEAEIKKHSS